MAAENGATASAYLPASNASSPSSKCGSAAGSAAPANVAIKLETTRNARNGLMVSPCDHARKEKSHPTGQDVELHGSVSFRSSKKAPERRTLRGPVPGNCLARRFMT